jgi:C-terminal processing protease CtpA/Prc
MMRTFFAVVVTVVVFAASALAANPALQFGGVGIDGAPRGDGTIVVKQLVLGGPAQLAGVRGGDVIVQIDGTPTLGSDFKEMVEHRLRGRAGTSVVLKVRRPGKPKPILFKLVRRQLALPGSRR